MEAGVPFSVAVDVQMKPLGRDVVTASGRSVVVETGHYPPIRLVGVDVDSGDIVLQLYHESADCPVVDVEVTPDAGDRPVDPDRIQLDHLKRRCPVIV